MSRTNASFVSEKKELSVFISYSHRDEEYRNQLERHLSFLKKTTNLKLWHDRKIMPGEEWEGKIDQNLNLADIILLLVSSDFANSKYCWDMEAKRAMERREQGDALVIPILIRPVEGWQDTPIGKLQSLPQNAEPVSTWPNQDEAYRNIAESLREVITNWSAETAYVETNWVYWYLKLDGQSEDYNRKCIHSIIGQLCKAANSAKLEYVESSKCSVELKFRSTQSVLDTLKTLHTEKRLPKKISNSILAIRSDPGAVLRIESRIVNKVYHSTIHYLPKIFGGRSLEEGFPPLVGGITFPLNNPMQIGFSLLTDSSMEMPTHDEKAELQARLGHYLNTFLVLSGDQVNVTLTPTDDYCGLPKLLRHTDLGRDMLAQDVVLKHHTACQLHPSTVHGKTFWDEVGKIADDQPFFEYCFRVWIVPGNATVHEKAENGHGHVTIENLDLKVLCEVDYDTLRRFRELQGKHAVFSDVHKQDDHIVDLFKKFIVPEIQREVSTGPRFGLLRQILSVLVIAKWGVGSNFGHIIYYAVFINNP